RILEIGAGGGELWRAFDEGIGRRCEIQYDAIDLCPPPPDWPSRSVWWQQDLLCFDRYGQYDLVVCNLILHHFQDSQLAELGQRLADGPRLLLACEPARRSFHQLQIALLGLCGLGYVTRHDAKVSIAAGFLGQEL